MQAPAQPGELPPVGGCSAHPPVVGSPGAHKIRRLPVIRRPAWLPAWLTLERSGGRLVIILAVCVAIRYPFGLITLLLQPDPSVGTLGEWLDGNNAWVGLGLLIASSLVLFWASYRPVLLAIAAALEATTLVASLLGSGSSREKVDAVALQPLDLAVAVIGLAVILPFLRFCIRSLFFAGPGDGPAWAEHLSLRSQRPRRL